MTRASTTFCEALGKTYLTNNYSHLYPIPYKIWLTLNWFPNIELSPANTFGLSNWVRLILLDYSSWVPSAYYWYILIAYIVFNNNNNNNNNNVWYNNVFKIIIIMCNIIMLIINLKKSNLWFCLFIYLFVCSRKNVSFSNIYLRGLFYFAF
jgi:hypothetical protein